MCFDCLYVCSILHFYTALQEHAQQVLEETGLFIPIGRSHLHLKNRVNEDFLLVLIFCYSTGNTHENFQLTQILFELNLSIAILSEFFVFL